MTSPAVSPTTEYRKRYRLHPLTLVYPATVAGRRQLIVEIGSADPPLLVEDPIFVRGLLVLSGEFTQEEAIRRWNAEPGLQAASGALWETAVREQLVVECSALDQRASRFDEWARYGWAEASRYHESTRDYPFLKMDEPESALADRDRMLRFGAEEPPPPIYQVLDSIFSERLVRLAEGESANDRLAQLSIEQRRGIEGLSLFFDVCFGERARIEFEAQGSFLRKSIPSGGARHPTETYLIAFERACLKPGVYHYNVRDHSLDCLKAGDFFAEAAHATFDLFRKYATAPAGLLVFASVYERAMWRYRDARSWRAVLIDMGHALMAYRSVSQVLGFEHYTYQKFRDSEIEVLLGLDALRQTPLFVGTLV